MTVDSATHTFMDLPPRLWRSVEHNWSYGAFRVLQKAWSRRYIEFLRGCENYIVPLKSAIFSTSDRMDGINVLNSTLLWVWGSKYTERKYTNIGLSMSTRVFIHSFIHSFILFARRKYTQFTNPECRTVRSKRH